MRERFSHCSSEYVSYSAPQMNRTFRCVSIAILIVGIVVAYHNTLHSPFVFDDMPNITQNENNHLTQIDLSSLKQVFSRNQSTQGRPFAHLTFAVNYYFGELKPFGYHLVNISIHILIAVLLFHLYTWYFRQDSETYHGAEYPALFCAFIWATSPVQVTAVTYVVQRMTSLCVLLTIASLICYIRARQVSPSPRHRYAGRGCFLYAASFLFWVLALLTKEIAVILPIIILLHEVYFFRSLSWNSFVRIKIYLFLFVSLLVLLSFYSLPYLSNIVLNGYGERPFTLWERLLTQSRVVLHYLSLFLYPDPERLMLFYDFPLSRSLTKPLSTLFSIVAIIFIILGALRFRQKARLISFGIVWTFLGLVLESTIIPLELVFEHRFYLPSVGFTLFLMSSGLLIFSRVRRGKILLFLVCSMLIVVQIFWTYKRNQVWSTELTLALDAVKKTPRLPRSVNFLAGAYIHAGDFESGRAELEKALLIAPADNIIISNLYMLHADTGRTQESFIYLERLKQSMKDGNFKCLQRDALMGVAADLMQRGYLHDVLFIYHRLEQCKPEAAVIYDNMAIAYEQTGDIVTGARYYEKALRVNPENFDYAISLAQAYYVLGDRHNANRLLKSLDRRKLAVHQKKMVDIIERNLLESAN